MNIPELLLDQTANIAIAYLSFNQTPTEEVPALIESIHGTLAGLGKAEAPLEPAVTIKQSVKPDAVTCLECGRRMKVLKRHLMTDHCLTTAEYLERWQLPASHPLTAPNYSVRRRELAKKIGLGRKRR